ncbi:hypothetical protein BCR34DRAFT_131049 [Clohesyomyces aquaticus]|uniref:C2H2-type domain-containing protein n=1 Tax=Clohesyomyces aquaticus TaxID=1231657 RepID=A0A1Y2AA86_9PLEO|nr:hypothetical protein BCR34DRAFT_131049 [Clohesyomyces aquaticus]
MMPREKGQSHPRSSTAAPTVENNESDSTSVANLYQNPHQYSPFVGPPGTLSLYNTAEVEYPTPDPRPPYSTQGDMSENLSCDTQFPAQPQPHWPYGQLPVYAQFSVGSHNGPTDQYTDTRVGENSGNQALVGLLAHDQAVHGTSDVHGVLEGRNGDNETWPASHHFPGGHGVTTYTLYLGSHTGEIPYDSTGDYYGNNQYNGRRSALTTETSTETGLTSALNEPTPSTDGHENTPDIYPDSSSETPGPYNHSVTCEFCGKVLTGQHANGNLKRHKGSEACRSREDRKDHPCPDCGKTYQRSDSLLVHRRKRHGAPPAAPKKSQS